MGYLGTKPQTATTLADNIVTADKIVSGAVTDAKIAAMAASKLTGQVPDANAPSGSVLQVVTASTSTRVQSNSTSWINLLSASITPSNASNIILVTANFNVLSQVSNSWSEAVSMFRLSDGTNVLNEVGHNMRSAGDNINNRIQSDINLVYRGTAGSTSARTYYAQGKVPNSGYYFHAFPDGAYVADTADSNYQLNNIGWITIMEIAA